MTDSTYLNSRFERVPKVNQRTFQIYRYDPDRDERPQMQTLALELDGSERMLLDALIRLLHGVQSTLPSLQWIAGHEDLDTTEVPASNDASVMVRRKRDPGPLFPWDLVLNSASLRRLPGG